MGYDFLMSLTPDPADPDLRRGFDEVQVDQSPKYLVLSDEERAKGFVRPVRKSYFHLPCGTLTTMNKIIAETYARQPDFYGGTYCCGCRKHRPLEEFVWAENGTQTDLTVGS